MSKKALAVIAFLILVPILLTVNYIRSWKNEKRPVAEYGETTDTVIYGSLTLKAVPHNDTYLAETGKFIGKIGDSLLGAGLYTVKNDKSGTIWATVNEKGLVLLTESGELPAQAFSGNKITRIFFDTFDNYTEETGEIALIEMIMSGGTEVIYYTPDKDVEVSEHSIHIYYDNCAVSTVCPGKFLHFEETGMWYYLSTEAEEKAKQCYTDGTSDVLEYPLEPVTGVSSVRLLKSFFNQSGVGETTE